MARPDWRAGKSERRFLALICGIAAALAHPPLGYLLGLLGYAGLLWLTETTAGTTPRRSAFLLGWLAGTGYFAVGTWWIAEAFFVDVAAHGWMAPFAVTFMASGLGLFWGAAAALYRTLPARGPLRVFVFAGALGLMEFARGHILSGFPWDLPGETWEAGSAMSQGAALIGAYGMTVFTVALGAAPRLWEERRGGRAVLLVIAATTAGLYYWGRERLANAETKAPDAPALRIVQPNLPQEAKYDPGRFAAIVETYVRLTAQPPAAGKPPPDIVFWPEGAIPAAANDYLAPGTWTAEAITGALRPGQRLVIGAYRVAPDPAGDRYFNVLIGLRREGASLRTLAVYDKFRLVPFGEFLPLESVLAPLGIKKLVQVGDGFSIGPRPRPVSLGDGMIIQPLICYESLFPGFTREGAAAAGQRARLLVNLSNDAWFGATSGPLQHLNLASYRAIEEGIPMVRATPTGVSALIDAYGRVMSGARLTHGEEGVIDARLPPNLAPTPFSRWGDTTFWLLELCCVLALVGGTRLRGAT
ncbi:MAG: apolipoprotein N-acyltransferase [Caulobacteraceae bacterium]